jgi:hypothetical protein
MMNGDSMIEDRTGKTFPDFTRPQMKLLLSLKTKPASFGLPQGAVPSFMMEKHLPR